MAMSVGELGDTKKRFADKDSGVNGGRRHCSSRFMIDERHPYNPNASKNKISAGGAIKPVLGIQYHSNIIQHKRFRVARHEYDT